MEFLIPLLVLVGGWMLYSVLRPLCKVSTIYGADGEHETPYMTRYEFGRLRLHIFHRGDADPDPHNHPWDFWTFPLTSYIEEVTVPEYPKGLWPATCEICDDAETGCEWCHLSGEANPPTGAVTKRQVVQAFRLHYRPAAHTHRVIAKVHEWVGLTDWQAYDGGTWEFHEDRWMEVPGRIVTIVWRSKGERHNWGFLKLRDGRWCWEPWKSYVFGGGKHAPCE